MSPNRLLVTDKHHQDAAARRVMLAGQRQRFASQIPVRMQFSRTLKSWNDDCGFGFIEPTHGGQKIFVHIKAFPAGTCTSHAITRSFMRCG